MGIFSALSSPEGLVNLLLTIPCVLITLTFHEFAHGIVAKKLGDNTAASLGRLTLNPIKHLDPIGTLCMIFFGFGWAKPVPIRPRNFKNPRRGMALTAAAGPIMNLLIALVTAFIAELMACIFAVTTPEFFVIDLDTANLRLKIMYFAFTLVMILHTLNICLALFNLIPLPPLDGSRIAYIFLPAKWYFGVMKYEQYIKMGFLILLWVSSTMGIPLLRPLNILEEWISNGMFRLAGKFFSLFF